MLAKGPAKRSWRLDVRKAKSINYVTFGPTERVVIFATDRGQLRSNDSGQFFFRKFTDGKFTCCSPDLERQLIDSGVRAGQPIGITRALYNRCVTWKVRAIGQLAEMPAPVPSSTTRKPQAKPSSGLPEQLYAKPEPPAPVWDDVQNATGANGVVQSAPSATGQTNGVQHTEAITPADGGLLGRCLVQALDACKVAQAHAATIGMAMTFDSGDIERMAVSLLIERTRNGSAIERKPAGKAPSGPQYVNGYAH